MIDLEKIKTSEFFTLRELQAGEKLFSEGDRDENLYIVYDGQLTVQKSIQSKKGDYKILSHLGIGNIVGEAALSHDNPKEVEIIAKRNTTLLQIHGKNEFPKYVTTHPKDAYSLLTAIIDISNTRLIRANDELTANYEVNVAISKIKDISITGIFKLLLVFQSILKVDQVMYFEKNLVMDSYFKLRFDSKNEHSMQNKIIKLESNILSVETLQKEGIEVAKFSQSVALNLGEENYGFLLIGRDHKDFNDNEEKLLQNTAGSFVGIIHQKHILDEIKNKSYIKSAL